MDANTVTLVVGLTGILATLISSCAGLFFTARARSSSLREALYERQLNLVVRMFSKQGRIRVLATIMCGDAEAWKEQARQDIRICIKELSELSEEGAAILPTELWVESKELMNCVTEFLRRYDTGIVSPDELASLAARDTKVALVARMVLGVDELSEQSLRLFSSTESLTRVAKIQISEFENMAKGGHA